MISVCMCIYKCVCVHACHIVCMLLSVCVVISMCTVFAVGHELMIFVTNQRMYLWWSLCTLYLHACQMRVTVGDSVFVVVLVWHLSRTN